MSFTNTLIEGDGRLCAMPLPAGEAASSLSAGPGALEMKVWTRRIDAVWAAFGFVADWYRREPKQAQDRLVQNYRAEAKARAEIGRNLHDMDRGLHLPV